MKRALLLVITLSFVIPFSAQSETSRAIDEVTIYRDEYGIPHVFAQTLEAASYAIGYAQAEDRLEELLKNYRRANGTMAEVVGPEAYRIGFAGDQISIHASGATGLLYGLITLGQIWRGARRYPDPTRLSRCNLRSTPSG